MMGSDKTLDGPHHVPTCVQGEERTATSCSCSGGKVELPVLEVTQEYEHGQPCHLFEASDHVALRLHNRLKDALSLTVVIHVISEKPVCPVQEVDRVIEPIVHFPRKAC